MVLSGVMVKMGVFAVLRWVMPVFPAAVEKFDTIVIGLAVAGMIYASLIAIVQDDLKRFVAYSSIAHIGLMAASMFAANQLSYAGSDDADVQPWYKYHWAVDRHRHHTKNEQA